MAQHLCRHTPPPPAPKARPPRECCSPYGVLGVQPRGGAAAAAAADAATAAAAAADAAAATAVSHAGVTPSQASPSAAPLHTPSPSPAESRPAASGAGAGDCDDGPCAAGRPGALEGSVETNMYALLARDPARVTDYRREIIQYQRELELYRAPCPTYMQRQESLNPSMRAILVDWMADVHRRFELQPETLFLSVSVVDRYLSCTAVARSRLHLVGITAMVLAGKFVEVKPPEVRDYVHICSRAYNREQILGMETAMLKALEYRVPCPTALTYMGDLLAAARPSCSPDRLQHLVAYIVERMLQEYALLQYLPSTVAAAAVNIGLRSLSTGCWDAPLEAYTGLTEDQLADVIRCIEGVLDGAHRSPLQAVRSKYSLDRYRGVGTLPLVHFMG